jgi:6-phosphogluconolactonase
MRVFARLLTPTWLSSVLLGLVVAAAAVLPASALASPTAWPAAGHVYVNDNTAGTNTIAGFARAADGSLTPLPGSPFSASGAGLGKGLGSQGAIQITANGRYLLAVDAGSNQISVLRIERNGSLEIVGGPVSSGGIDPVSIAIHRHLVYVANAGNGVTGANYTGFTLRRGVLTPLAGSTVALSPTAGPDDVLFNSDGTKLVGNEVTPSVIDSFTVGHNGLLTAAPGSPFTAQGLGPFGSEFRPTNPNQLFVTNAHNGTGLGTVSAFNDAANGTLSSIGSSPFPDFQTAPCWLVISHDGQYLFAVNTASGTISRYWIAPRGALTLLGSTNVAAGGGVGGTDPGLSADGRYLYVDEAGIDSVGEFAVNGGNLTELASSPVALPAGATPAGIVVN